MSIARLNLGKFMAFDPDTGKPLSLGKVHTYEPGTTTNKDAYTAQDGLTVLANPVILDALGQAEIYLSGEYDLVITNSDDVVVDTISSIYGAADEDGVASVVAATMPTISTFMKTVLDDTSATAARATLGAASPDVGEVVTLEWEFDNRLALINSVDGPTDLRKWRLESAGTTGNLLLKMLEDDDTVIDTALNIAHDALGATKFTFSIQGAQALQLKSTSLEVNNANMWGDRLTINDDEVGTITPPSKSGLCILTAAPTSNTGHPNFSDQFHYHTGTNSPSSESTSPAAITYASDVGHTTGVLAGTTGTDGKVTISPQADGTIQIENRSGGNRIFRVFFF